MAKRSTGNTTTGRKTTAANAAEQTQEASSESIDQRIVAFAEQVGRIVGTVQAKTGEWLDREALSAQLAQVRDGAAQLLEQLTPAALSKGRSGSSNGASAKTPRKNARAVAAAPGANADPAHAPGKKHRKPVPNEPMRAAAADRGRIAKMKAINARRQRGR
jgi:hypothetical protein